MATSCSAHKGRAENGNDAFTQDQLVQFYEENGAELWEMLYMQCRDRERTQDAMQEVFARLLKHAHENDPIDNIMGWCVRVGTNWLRDRARRKSSSQLLWTREQWETFSDAYPAKEHRPDQIHAQSEVVALIRLALQTLASEDREVLVLRYGRDWPSKKIAAALGDTTLGAVDMRLSRARSRFAEALADVGYTYEDWIS